MQKIVLDGEEVNIPVGGGSTGGMSVPSGVIWPWYHTADQAVSDGWALCNGENGTPDLRGRFLLGASDDHAIGSTGGSEEVTLTVEQMPEHIHSIVMLSSGTSTWTANKFPESHTSGQGTNRSASTGNTGSSKPHPNMPPYFAIDYIMKL